MKLTFRKVAVFLLVVALMALPVLAFIERQNILDWAALRNYQPPARVVRLADDTTMNAYARRVFYVNHPLIEDKVEFRKDCAEGEVTIVLGCYVSNSGIYVYDVQDNRLNGVHEVTAAHEMLHAAYDRLSSKERENVNKMVLTTYNSLNDARIAKTIDIYKKKDPKVVPNELHSILGTEVRNLPPNLEAYYKRYFNNRLAIVSKSENYENNFTDREDKIASYDNQLTDLKKKIDNEENSLHSQLAVLQSQRADMDAALARKDYSTFNGSVNSYNSRVNQYNALLNTLKTNIESYNKIVAARNAIADEEKQLIQAIDSRPLSAQ